MTATPVRLGLVGCGRLAEAGYLPALRAASSVRLVAVADPDALRRDHVAAMAQEVGAARYVGTFPDLQSLLTDASVDALVLASPAAAHLPDAERAAAAGVPVLVEKPPAPDVAGAVALARLAPAPFVGFNRRFDPGARAVRDAIRGAGDVALELELAYRRASWAPVTVHDDALVDLGPHLVDWARWLTGGDVVEVRNVQVAPDHARVDLVLTRGRARLSASVAQPHREHIVARDASGAQLARHRLGGIVASVRDRLAGRSGPHAMVATLAAQLEALGAAVREGAPSERCTAADGTAAVREGAPSERCTAAVREGAPSELGTAADGVAAMAVLDAARTCAAERRPVTVHQPSEA